MTSETLSSARKTTPCPGCGGSGQTSYFAGESRFMLTWEDCPDCSGTGVLLETGKINSIHDSSQDKNQK